METLASDDLFPFFEFSLASILKHMAHCFNLTHQMEYLLATGTLRSRSGLGLMQVQILDCIIINIVRL